MAASIVKSLLPALSGGRALIDKFGLRNFRVFVRTTTWSGLRVGIGTKSAVTTELTEVGGAKPQVVQLSADRVVASGAQIGDDIFEVTVTPEYDSGGTDPSKLTPDVASGREVHFIIKGPGYPNGSLCDQLSVNTSSPFRYVMRLKATGAKP